MHNSDTLDKFYRNLMLSIGILAAILFILSLVALIEFPGAFKAIAFAMIGTAIIFLLLRTVYNFRKTFRVKTKNKATHTK